jgi:hypothetical protein
MSASGTRSRSNSQRASQNLGLRGNTHFDSECAGIRSTVYENILTGNVTGLSRTQECASRSKLLRAAEPPRRIARPDILSYGLNGAFCISGERLQVRFQPHQLSAPFCNLVISFLQARVKSRSKSNSFTALGLIFEYFISSTK